MTSPVTPPDDFEAAKSVFEKLKDLPTERQERVLRWVAEGLGVLLASSGSAASRYPTATAKEVLLPSPAGSAQKDIKSFVGEKKPRSDNQFAAAVAYYYRFEAAPAQRRDTIDAKLLQEATRLAGRSRLSNPNFTLNNAKNQGYLDGSARGEFSINTIGENLVAMTSPATAAPAERVQRPRSPAGRHGASGTDVFRP